MSDITLGPRPYTLVSTVVRRNPIARYKLAQLDMHLTSSDLRIRFLEPASIARLYLTLHQLAMDAYCPELGDRHLVTTRIYTDKQPSSRQVEEHFFRSILDHDDHDQLPF